MSGPANIKGLVPITHIKGWEREYARLGRKVEQIEKQRATIKTMINAARALKPHDDETRRYVRVRKSPLKQKRLSAVPPESHGALGKAPPSVKKVKPARPERSEWNLLIRESVNAAAAPVPYSAIKQRIVGTPLGEKLERSEKGFYHAISRLVRSGEIVRYRSYLFSPQAYQKFLSERASGLTRDLRPQNGGHHSPIGDATMAMMKSRPNGAESGHIIWELKKDPLLAEIITKNKTHAYNVFARLVNTGLLVKRGKRFFAAELLKNEAPSNAEGASTNLGESGTSPSDSRKGGATTLFG